MEIGLKILLAFFMICTCIGLIKPWMPLWWMERQNRLLVLKYYGIPAAILGLVLLLT